MEPPETHWTLGTLKIYIERRFDDLETLYNERFDGQKDAVSVALASAERATSKTDTAFAVLDEKVASLASRIDRHEGAARGLTAGWGYLIAAIGGVGTLVAIAIAIASLT